MRMNSCIQLMWLVLALICCVGCMVLPVAYYRPSGEGQLGGRGQFEHFCADRFYTPVVDGVRMQVQAVPHGNNTVLHIQINVDKSKKWFRLEKDELRLSVGLSGPVRLVKIPSLKKSYDLVIEVERKKVRGPLERIENAYTIPYDIEVEVPDFCPGSFVLDLPVVVADDQRVELPPVSFEYKRGARLYNAGQ